MLDFWYPEVRENRISVVVRRPVCGNMLQVAMRKE